MATRHYMLHQSTTLVRLSIPARDQIFNGEYIRLAIRKTNLMSGHLTGKGFYPSIIQYRLCMISLKSNKVADLPIAEIYDNILAYKSCARFQTTSFILLIYFIAHNAASWLYRLQFIAGT